MAMLSVNKSCTTGKFVYLSLPTAKHLVVFTFDRVSSFERERERVIRRSFKFIFFSLQVVSFPGVAPLF